MIRKFSREQKIKTKTLIACLSSLVAIFFIFAVYFDFSSIESFVHQIAGPFFAEKISTEQILTNYKNDKIKILIVPGHDNESFGTQFNETRESQLNAYLGKELFDFLQNNDKFDIYTTRVQNGDYSDWFNNYFQSHKKEIGEFRESSKKQWLQAVNFGMPLRNQVEHNSVANDTSLRLYAVNKWANENDIGVVIHIHFNDYPFRKLDEQGRYAGFSIYVPEYQLPNNVSSSNLASSIKKQLEKFFAKSSLPQESLALIEDQELIAVGSNASRDGISILIEYGYIYEPQFANKETRLISLKEMAYQTYIGIEKFFGENKSIENTKYETTMLPHKWNNTLKKGMEGMEDIIRLQTALLVEGLYPPKSKSIEECPLNGVFRICTHEAVKKFQEKYSNEILAENEKPSGFVGPKTLAKLNQLYGE